MNLITPKLSGFILQKDVYTANILYENDLIPMKNIKKNLPFRPKTGRIPKDPRNCLQILKQIHPIPNIQNIEDIFILKKRFKSKKLKKMKLKFPLPKYRLRPISANDFYKNIRKANIRTKNIEDDLNITSKHGKKIYFSFKDDLDSERSKYKEKYVKAGKGNLFYDRDKTFDEYFDYGFHVNKENDNFLYTPKRVKSNPKFKIRNMFLSKKKVYKKDKTFKTQIDFNLLDASNRFMLSGSNTTKFQIKPYKNFYGV